METCPRFPTLTARQARGPCQPAPGSSRSCRQYEQCDAAADPGNEGQTPQLVEIGDIARGVHYPGGDENKGDLGRSGRISAGEVCHGHGCREHGERFPGVLLRRVAARAGAGQLQRLLAGVAVVDAAQFTLPVVGAEKGKRVGDKRGSQQAPERSGRAKSLCVGFRRLRRW